MRERVAGEPSSPAAPGEAQRPAPSWSQPALLGSLETPEVQKEVINYQEHFGSTGFHFMIFLICLINLSAENSKDSNIKATEPRQTFC